MTHFRALIRVIGQRYVNNELIVKIPSWEPDVTLTVSVPDTIYSRALAGKIRFYAWLNLGAECEKDLDIRDWETS